MPLYEFKCNDCGVFDMWRIMAESSIPAHCPVCEKIASRIFSPPMLLSSSLRLKKADPEPQLVKRLDQPVAPKLQTHADGRPWMINH